jgi:phosphoglucomutase
VQLYETPVGFKYIGELIMEDKIVIGGEESAGLSIRHHVPEKDGVLAGIAVLRSTCASRQVAAPTFADDQ